MHTNYFTALRTDPSFIFVSYELPYAEFLYIHQIIKHTHPIVCCITIIQMAQTFTGKLAATEAVPGPPFYYLLAVLDPACDTDFRFQTIVTPTTGARILISYIGSTEAAI
jgi:hypothetical protein